MIKSPLRYPGGKTRAISIIYPLIPKFSEYREPFIGGGSVFIYLKQKNQDADYWINDLNFDLYLFWKYAKEKNNELVDTIKVIKKTNRDGKKLFIKYKGKWENYSNFDRAVRFFILNRITFSGTIDSGGYSQESFEKRFTDSSIMRLGNIQPILNNTRITNLDYEEVVQEKGENIFLFLDPPYYSQKSLNLYGKNGDLHRNFDHNRFAEIMMDCSHKWLITYDDCEETRYLFRFANIIPWTSSYRMRNIEEKLARKGEELIITNYSTREI